MTSSQVCADKGGSPTTASLPASSESKKSKSKSSAYWSRKHVSNYYMEILLNLIKGM
ncbi:hypothetical protein C1H46_029368 [Malus baccata]|uniref:Uncharacterized protein n=1 Tax=Malus baccata TaxID=106549 RepID=A0A540LF54_MALBA|nr:hypothetical protein C1H46_029368 [Malus baccata]